MTNPIVVHKLVKHMLLETQWVPVNVPLSIVYSILKYANGLGHGLCVVLNSDVSWALKIYIPTSQRTRVQPGAIMIIPESTIYIDYERQQILQESGVDNDEQAFTL